VANRDWLLAPLDLAVFVLAVWLIVEAVVAIRGARSEARDVSAPADRS
jgi:carbon starvation protein